MAKKHSRADYEREIEFIVDLFRSGEIPEAIHKATIEADPNLPFGRWSFGNQLTCLYIGKTKDARTFKQWKTVGRHVKKGSKAFHLWKPLVASKTNKKTGETDSFCFGFGTFAVFRIEDTDGEPVAALPPVDKLPLIDVAHAWGIDVNYEAFGGYYLGAYMPDSDSIRLATLDESTFLHELAHAAHKRSKGSIEGGQHAGQEIVAELSAAVLAHHLGVEANLGNAYRYIDNYAKTIDKTPVQACLAVMKEVSAVVKLIMDQAVAIKIAA